LGQQSANRRCWHPPEIRAVIGIYTCSLTHCTCSCPPGGSLSPPSCCLQLIITHIPARRASIRCLLAAQGLLLRQPTPGGADWLDDSGAAFGLLCAQLWQPAC
jgi:hypothetical protein